MDWNYNNIMELNVIYEFMNMMDDHWIMKKNIDEIIG